jgi:hypothetical protein
MQAANSIVKVGQNVVQMPVVNQNSGVAGWITRLFGCWHKEMSRPFSLYGQTYRTCLDCGARRQFNAESWEMQGDYYYRTGSTSNLRAA